MPDSALAVLNAWALRRKGRFVSLRRVLNLLNLSEFDMIDDPYEVQQDVLEEIDPDLVSYTFSTRGVDQLIYLYKVYQIIKKLPTAAGPF